MLDFNGTGISGQSLYGTAYINANTLQGSYRGRGVLQHLVYMSANDYFIVRGASASTVVGSSPTTDGGSYIKIAKIK